MSEGGDGNIKVVVRCRPLNSRGAFHCPITMNSCIYHHSRHAQNSREVPSLSFACRGTKRFSIPQRLVRHRMRNERQSARHSHLHSTRAIGRRARATSLAIVLSKPSLTILARNYWTIRLGGSMRVSWLVSAMHAHILRR